MMFGSNRFLSYLYAAFFGIALAATATPLVAETWVPTVNEKGERGWLDLDPLIWDDSTNPPDPTDPNNSEFVPDGYVKTWSQEFSAPTKVVDLVAAKAGDELVAGWGAWNIRHLQGNNDKAGKVATAETLLLNPAGTALLVRSLNKPLTAQLRGGATRTYQFTAGMLSTEFGHKQKLGYFEVRMKATISKGDHVAVWLLRSDNSYNKNAFMSELDMVELVGGHDKFYFNDHGPGTGAMTQWPGNGQTDNWNTYGVLLTENGTVWYLNGQEVRRSLKPMNTEVYWLLTHETGGNWPGMPDSTTRWPHEVEIDYVRIYKAP